MNSTIRIGLIGAGRIARVHARSISRIDGACLAAVYDLDFGKASEVARDFGGKAFARPDDVLSSSAEAVIICVPTFLHRRFAMGAIRAGKHVLCEKPIAPSLEEAGEMIARAGSAGIKFLVGHVLRFHPAFKKLQKMLSEGTLGTVRHIHASRLSGGAGGSWEKWLLEKPEGLGVFDLNIHDLDFIHWVLGRPSSVAANGIANSQGNFLHVDTLLKFPLGARASVEGSFLIPRSHPFQYELRMLGEKGCLSFSYRGTSYDDPGAKQEIVFFADERVERIEIPAQDPYEEEMRYFLRCVTDNLKVEIGTGEDARAALQMVLAVRKSAETGLPLEI